MTYSASNPLSADDELRNHFSRLVAENQSDEFLARGMPKEFVLISTERVAAIKQAYDAIAGRAGDLAQRERRPGGETSARNVRVFVAFGSRREFYSPTIR